jgi:hypothetical protein
LRSIDKEISHADLKLKIADLTSSLADIKITLTDARSEATEKDAEIARLLKLHRRLADDTIELFGYRYRKSDKRDGPAGNPFCPVCLQKEGVLLELADTTLPGRPLKCPNCNAVYAHLHTYLD